jgi:hypothetical protein
MDVVVAVGGHGFRIVTEDWPFADDEKLCVDLVAGGLSRLEGTDRRRFDDACFAFENGISDEALFDVLSVAHDTATRDYDTGINRFTCALAVEPATAWSLA